KQGKKSKSVFDDEDLPSHVKPEENTLAVPKAEETAETKKPSDDYLDAILGDTDNYRVYLDSKEEGGDDE
ncbi:MAG: hypothetical protein ACI4RB_06845, partial [Acutalibacteraceae bacterium]